MLAVDRTHSLEDDLAWAPRVLTKRLLWFTKHYYREPHDQGAWPWWVALFFAPLVFVPLLGDLVLLIAPAVAGSGGEADRSASYDDALVLGRLHKLNARSVSVGAFDALSDGSRVRVEGRVVAAGTFPGVLTKAHGVARRLVFRGNGRWWVHEALVDFEIEDDSGHRLLVNVADARLLAHLGPPVEVLASDLQKEDAPTRVQRFFRETAGTMFVLAAEHVLVPGARVSILGLKRSAAEPSGYRETSARPVLAGGIDLPLLIIPVR